MLLTLASDVFAFPSAADEAEQTRQSEDTSRASVKARRAWLLVVLGALSTGCSFGKNRGDRERSHAGRL